MSEYWSDVNMWTCADYKTGSTVLDSEVCRPKTEGDQPRESSNSQCVRVQESRRKYKKNNRSVGGITSEVAVNSTNTSDFQESSFADEI